jgi:hypothetical protein
MLATGHYRYRRGAGGELGLGRAASPRPSSSLVSAILCRPFGPEGLVKKTRWETLAAQRTTWGR